MMNYYRAFGLNFASAIPTAMLPLSKEPLSIDVEIHLGNIADLPTGQMESDNWYQAHGNTMLIKTAAARFLIENGSSITVDPISNDWNYISIFLLGSVIAALLHQRQLIVLHATAIAIDEKAVLIAAPTGGGKSTLAAAFLQKGYQLLSDDVCAIECSSFGSPLLQPSYPQMKICQNVIDLLGFDKNTYLQVGHHTHKYYVPMEGSFYPTPLPLSRVVILNSYDYDGKRSISSPIKGIERFKELLKHTYRYLFLNPQHCLPIYFTQAATLLQNVEWHRVTRPRQAFTPFDLIELICNL